MKDDINNEEILTETLQRFYEIKINKETIVNDDNKRKEIENLLKTIIDLIIKKKDIDLIIPNNFKVPDDNINDNINRIIYWCYFLYYYPNKYIDICNKNKNLDINIRFKELHKCVLAQQEYFYNEIIKLNKCLLIIKKEYKIIINLQVIIIGLLFIFLIQR